MMSDGPFPRVRHPADTCSLPSNFLHHHHTTDVRPEPLNGVSRFGLALALMIVALAPARASAAVIEGHRACDYCRMLLEDPRFGAEVTLGSGAKKIYDAVECMAAAVLTDSVAVGDVRAISLTDHALAKAPVPIDRAVFLHCPELTSPMGLSLLAFRSRADADTTCPARRATVLDWRGVLAQVNARWFQGRLAVEPHVKFPRLKPSSGPKPAR